MDGDVFRQDTVVQVGDNGSQSEEDLTEINIKDQYKNLFTEYSLHNPITKAIQELLKLRQLCDNPKYVRTERSQLYYQTLEQLKKENNSKPYVYLNFEKRKETKIHNEIMDEFKQLPYVNCIGLVYSTIRNKQHHIGNFLLILKCNPQQSIVEQINEQQVLDICIELRLKTLVGIMMKTKLSSEIIESCIKLKEMKMEKDIDLIVGTIMEQEQGYFCSQKQGKQIELQQIQEQEVLIRIGSNTLTAKVNRKLSKKNSIFYQQSVMETEGFKGKYERNVDELQIFKDDGYLNPFKEHFNMRNGKFFEIWEQIVKLETSIKDFAKGYEKYGLIVSDTGITYREWAPGVKEMYLTGDFNNWDNKQHSCTADNFGNWEIFLPKNEDGSYPINHNTKIRTYILDAQNNYVYKIPTWITTTKQNEENKSYDGIFWNPENKYEFKNPRPLKNRCLKIYEVHIGMAGVEERVHTFKEFTKDVLPRVIQLGYNTIQIMAIQEHAYYGSFGYHVTNFFAVSSRFGTPDDLKELIDTAHFHGISVLMDLVHSHASKNVNDGLNDWDGTDYQYFHSGIKGQHQQWDSRLFDYSKWEVIRFLLSNLSWWINEYQFDGFRFDGITSMLYTHHGLGFGFTGNYNEYFNEMADLDSIVYLMLANDLIHEILPDAITIAEDVSGYPSLCRTIKEGGIGFDYRMAMAVPDKWIKLLKESSDDEWDMKDIVHTLTNRRYLEKCICYAECHDQALVGDKTISTWLYDKEIYTNMSKNIPESIITFRGTALHKMIRLITIALGGEGYLTFMGNEFGHPEWIDFPREGNGWSYKYAIRRWYLADDPQLKYHSLLQWDIAMIHLEEQNNWLPNYYQFVGLQHNDDKIITFERGNLLFVFNFHPTKSFENYRVGTRFDREHQIILDTDQDRFGGHSRLAQAYNQNFPIIKEQWNDRPNYIQVYIPNRCAAIFKAIEQ